MIFRSSFHPMTTKFIKKIIFSCPHSLISHRHKMTSNQYVASRIKDASFEELMINYKNLLKVVKIQDLILANPNKNPPSVAVEFLDRLSRKFHFKHGANKFLRKFPCIFKIYHDRSLSKPFCKLTPSAMRIFKQETAAINKTHPLVIDRLIRLLSMSVLKTLPLRAILKMWKEFGLPDDFEDSILSKNPHIFQLVDAHEPNTHLIKLVGTTPSHEKLSAAVDNWRIMECCKDDCSVGRTELMFSFKQSYPPRMKMKKKFKDKVKRWQRMPYIGPYDEFTGDYKKKSEASDMNMEKRAVAILHEFLSLTVEKTVEVEQISHFRKWFGIDMNVRDLFLDHPGMFYLSTKGRRHTVFLREAYVRGCLIDPNPVYAVRRKLLGLVILGRRCLRSDDFKLSESESESESKEDYDLQEVENDKVEGEDTDAK